MEQAPYSAPYPPSYPEVTLQHVSQGGGLSFVDFLPPCLWSGAFHGSANKHIAMYDTFRVLIDYANFWLRQNPAWEAKTCESVEFKTKSDETNPELMTYSGQGEGYTYLTRWLRLWIVPRTDLMRPAQQLAYIHLIPTKLSDKPTYETLDQLLCRYNGQVRVSPAPGRILSVETQEVTSKSSNFDVDRTRWSEHYEEEEEIQRNFLSIIRIFFEVGPHVNEELGIEDIVPNISEPEGCCSYPKYENFSNVLVEASDWLSRQSNLRFCSAQTVEIMYRPGSGVNTKDTFYVDNCKTATYYVRILRLAYVRDLAPTVPGFVLPKMPVNLQCKTFVPVQLTKGNYPPTFETLSQTKQRVDAWVRLTGAHMLSCETMRARLSWSKEPLKNIFRGHTTTNGARIEHGIFVLRLYLDGAFEDPPARQMPPIPEIQEVESCSIL